MIMGLAIILKIDLRFKSNYYCSSFGYYSENLLPVIGGVCFMSIISVLLDVFLCVESTSDNFEDSFMLRDCHQYCW